MDVQLRRRLNAIVRNADIPAAIAYINSGRTVFPPAADNAAKRHRFARAFGLPFQIVQVEGDDMLVYQYQEDVPLTVATDELRPIILEGAFERAGLGTGIDALYEFIAAVWLGITREQVAAFLRTQISYQLTRKTTTKSNPLKRPRAARQIWAVDLIDLSNIVGRGNQGRNYIMTVVDVFTRQVWLRSLATKTAAEVGAAYETISDEDFRPATLQLDNGKEWPALIAYARNLGTVIVHSHTYTGVSWVEQVNGQVRDMIAQLGVQRGNKQWSDQLENIEEQINSKNATWMQREYRVRAQDRRDAADAATPPRTARFNVGDRVRVAKIAFETAIRKLNSDGFMKHVYVKRSQRVYIIRSVLNQSIVNGFFTYTLFYENDDHQPGQVVEDFANHAALYREKDLTGPIPLLQRGVTPTDAQVLALNRK